MSVKASWFQIGLSNTANLNFHWRNLLDGVLRLTRGNAGAPIADVMLVNADNSVAFPGGVSSGVLGAGQTWKDMFGSRVANTTYTNTTGVPIQLAVYWTNAIANGLTIDGANFFRAGSSSAEGNTLSPIIPAGSTYSASPGFGLWRELRA